LSRISTALGFWEPQEGVILCEKVCLNILTGQVKSFIEFCKRNKINGGVIRQTAVLLQDLPKRPKS
jgi:hypothetical protein